MISNIYREGKMFRLFPYATLLLKTFSRALPADVYQRQEREKERERERERESKSYLLYR